MGAVFGAIALPLIAPGVLSARNQNNYNTADDLRLDALPFDTALQLSKISRHHSRQNRSHGFETSGSLQLFRVLSFGGGVVGV